MKRPLLLSTAFLLLLLGCTRSEHQLPSQEVLRRAAQASLERRPSHLVMDAHVEMQDAFGVLKATIHTDGRIGSQSQQLALRVDVDVEQPSPAGPVLYGGSADVVVIGGDEVFFRLLDVRGAEQATGLNFGPDVLQRWWRISVPSRENGSVTTDPQILRAQSQVVRVVKDRGVDVIEGIDVYHYDVEVDREKLFAFLQEIARARGEEFDAEATRASIADVVGSGQLWIDAETFDVRRVSWALDGVLAPAGQKASVQITADLRDDLDRTPITPPQDYQEFLPTSLLQLQPPTAIPNGGQQEQDIFDYLQQHSAGA